MRATPGRLSCRSQDIHAMRMMLRSTPRDFINVAAGA
jgi:hypothetical protein